jgi:hypothetical protein
MKRFSRSQTLLSVGKGILCDFLSRLANLPLGSPDFTDGKAVFLKVGLTNSGQCSDPTFK